ncbi:hypothetical protein JCM10213_008635 [Rhodosporidiobolus nylandii]
MIPQIPHSPLYRRRPPRLASLPTSLLSCLLVALFASTAWGQSNTSTTTLSYGSITSLSLTTGQGQLFHLPATSSSFAVSLSLCAQPAVAGSNGSFSLPTYLDTVLYLSTDPTLSAPGPDDASPSSDQGATSSLSSGWANVTSSSAPDGVWIAVYAPKEEDVLSDNERDSGLSVAGEKWAFELEISAEGGSAGWVFDRKAGLRVEDTDRTGVLLSTANYTTANQSSASPPSWVPLIAEASPASPALSRSKCFVRTVQQAAARAGRNTTKSETTRGYGGGMRSQFEVRGLEGGRNYTAWLMQNGTGDTGDETRVWQPVFFQTKSSDSCRLVHDLPFCPSVAYAVPSPPSLATSDLITYFNSSLSPSLAAFARTLTTFPCDVPEMGRYSVVSICADCYAAYRDWLCATTIPRCADAPANATLNDTTTIETESGLATWYLPEETQTLLTRDDPFASRTPAFGPANLSATFPSLFNSSYPASSSNLASESPFPYAEVPPCTDTCNLVEARCPPFLGWSCPKMGRWDGQTGLAGYGVTREVDDEDRVVGDVEHSSRKERAQDRWGNVFCNALYTDLTSAAQFVDYSQTSGTPSSLPSPRSLLYVLSTLVVVLLASAFL